MANRFLGTD